MKGGNDMRNTFGVIIVLLTCLLILPCSQDVNGAEWKLYWEGESLLFFYDADSINFLPNNIRRVWVQIIPNSEQDRVGHIQHMRKTGRTIPDNWGFTRTLMEFDCENRTSAILSFRLYSTKDESIKGETFTDHSFLYIEPETQKEALYRIVCAEKDTKKKGR